MSIKYKKNGLISDIIIPACEVQVFDMKENFNGNNLEDVLQEIGDSDSIYVSDKIPDKDGVWISSDNSTVAQENGIVKELKQYINNDILPKINKNSLDIHNKNLITNGDFRIWRNGTEFKNIPNGYVADKWYTNVAKVNSVDITKIDVNGGLKLSVKEFNGEYVNLEYHFDLNDYYKLLGKTVTISIKLKNKELIERIGFRAYPDNSKVQDYKEAKDFYTWTTTLPKCSQECTKFMFYLQKLSVGTLDIEYIKLELGDNATTNIFQPYADELHRCNMYNENNQLEIPYSNNNILINSNFTNTINQRNSNTYTKKGYSIDRWHLLPVEKDGQSLIVNSNYISLKSTELIELRQFIEDFKTLRGKQMTWTIKYRMSKESSGNVKYYSREQLKAYGLKTLIADGQWHVETQTFIEPQSESDKNSMFIITLEKGNIDIEYAKVELGTSSTMYLPKTYSEELALCQRYYQKGEYHGYGYIGTSGSGYISMPVSIQMRVKPTINIIKRGDIRTPVGNKTPKTLILAVCNPSEFVFNYDIGESLSGISIQSVIFYDNTNFEFDSEIY